MNFDVILVTKQATEVRSRFLGCRQKKVFYNTAKEQQASL